MTTRGRIASLAAAALLLAACGSGDTAQSPTSSVTATTVNASGTPQPTATHSSSPTPGAATSVVTPTATPSPPPSGASGIEGRVLVGPTCPVERADSPCPDRPVSVALAIYSAAAANNPVATVTSDADGRFHVELPPGTYTVQRAPCDATSPQCAFPRITPVDVTVQLAAFTQVTVQGDTGIR